MKRLAICALLLTLIVFLAACTPDQAAKKVARSHSTEMATNLSPTAASVTVLSATPVGNTPAPAAIKLPADTSTDTPVPTNNTPTPSSAPTSLPTATFTSTLAITPALPPKIPSIALQPLANDFDQPVYLTHAGDGSNRLFVVERRGKVRVVQNNTVQTSPFMNIGNLVGAGGQEQGLLSMAFHPNFANNRRVFVNYTNNDGDTVVAEYHTTPDLSRVDPDTAQILLIIHQPYGNHNGGQLQFGPDGNLYIGVGDGGAANDPHGNGQKLFSLLGKILRINVDSGKPYATPADNPFVKTIDGRAARPEIWALGLRNPWRFTFDRLTGDMYIGDVGQNKFEEIDFEPANSSGGLNYGWNVMEGFHCFNSASCNQSGLTQPVAEYTRDDGCSVTGGYVYRGRQYPSLNGVYLYGDYCSGKIWALRAAQEPELLLDTDLGISSFGEDESGELYVVDLQGEIYKIVVLE